jgi:[ribosomal protein S5]-alanine N-acetyltransferase
LSHHYIFETERLVVRQYNYELDKENFFCLNGDEDVVRYIRPAKSRGECEIFLKQVIADAETNPLMGRWAVIEKASGNFVGSFAFIPIEGSDDLQLGYALLKEYWGKGFATELMKEGINYVFTKTSLNEIYGVTEAANIASQRVLLKSGLSFHKNYREGVKDLCSFRLVRPN